MHTRAASDAYVTPRCCVVVADRAHARLFRLAGGEAGRQRLVEEADFAGGEGRPPGAPADRRGSREPQRLALEYVAELAQLAAALARDWEDGEIVLVAAPQILGQLRTRMRSALGPRVVVKALARQYASLTATQLARELGLDGRPRKACR